MNEQPLQATRSIGTLNEGIRSPTGIEEASHFQTASISIDVVFLDPSICAPSVCTLKRLGCQNLLIKPGIICKAIILVEHGLRDQLFSS